MLSRHFRKTHLLDKCLLSLMLVGCGTSAELVSIPVQNTQGTLTIRANGEDFIRQGFTSKEGWHLSFKQAALNMGAVTAYQTQPGAKLEDLQALPRKQQVSLGAPRLVDLAAGDPKTEAVLVGTISAPAGHYNALSWQWLKATRGDAAGASLVLQGLARKGSQQLPFTLKLDREVAFVCGDYVGEERKGLLSSAGQADLEATFHFDHLFGDGSLSPKAPVNQKALGFEPLAKLATQGRLEITASQLASQLSANNANKLATLWLSLGHVGEGHCQAKYL